MDSDTLIFGGFISVLVILGGLLIWATVEEGKACERAGGHMISKSSPGFGVGGNGQMVSTVNTVSFCISQDGRILE